MKILTITRSIYRMYCAGGIQRIWHEIDNYFFDILNKTDTYTRRPLETYDKDTPYIESAFEYMPSYTQTIKTSLNKIIKKDDNVLKSNFLDIGCGKGKIMLIASTLGFKTGVGFEINKNLSIIAEKNLIIKKIENKYKIINENAVNKNIIPEFSVCYFYNPFNKVMSQKFFNILEEKKTKINKYLIYVNPLFSKLLNDNWDLIDKFNVGTQDVQIWKYKN
jgi:16S rRNA G966 N2-methylase RsmD